MSIYRPIIVACDWPVCSVWLETWRSTAVDARKQAAEAGWVRVEGLDFCGPANDDVTGAYRFTKPVNHAEMAKTGDHRPVFEHDKRSVKAGCSCGWTDTTWFDSRVAGISWRNHVWDAPPRSAGASEAERKPMTASEPLCHMPAVDRTDRIARVATRISRLRDETGHDAEDLDNADRDHAAGYSEALDWVLKLLSEEYPHLLCVVDRQRGNATNRHAATVPDEVLGTSPQAEWLRDTLGLDLGAAVRNDHG